MGEGDRRRLEVNWVQTIAAPLAAVTSAVLLSTVGVAGTILGAALGSLAYTLGTAIYSHYIGATKDRVVTAQKVAATRIGQAQSRVQEASENLDAGSEDADEELARAGEELHEARSALEDAGEDAPRVGWRTVLAGLPWKRIAVVASGVFLVAMLVIVSFELVSGRAVSTYTGGSDGGQRTSLPGFLTGRSGDRPPVPGESPSEGPSPTTDATGGSTGGTATASATRTPTPGAGPPETTGGTTAPQEEAPTASSPTPTSATPTPLATTAPPSPSPTP